MEEGLLSLKWNNHKSTFFHILSILREKHTYTDVTLACDGRLYPVHKFILSTCSEYFNEIFVSNTGNNIVIVLKDVRRQDLEYLLDYMYLGQVDVAQSELSSLIKTAECLRIKGLAIPDDEPQTTSRRGVEERERDTSPPSKKKRHHADENRTSGLSSNNISHRIQPILPIPPPPSSLPPHTVQQQQQQQQALLQRLQVPISQHPQPPPTSQPSGKSHPSSLSHTASSRISQMPTSPITTSLSHPSHNPPLSSPTQPTVIPVIKQEVTDPMESEYVNENYEDTKPDLSESQHLEQDMAVAGPSGIQGSADNWDGESDLGSYAGGEAYSEGGLEETGDSEAQGGPSIREAPMGDAEEFLRQLEDKTHQQDRQQLPLITPSTPYSPSEVTGGVFSGAGVHPIGRPYFPRPMFPTSGGSLISCGSLDTGSSPRHPENSFSHTCSLCAFTGSNLQELITHRQTNHLESLPPQKFQHLESHPPQKFQHLEAHPQKIQHHRPSSEEKMFKCPYCSIVVKGRNAIESHVINHSAGEEGPDRRYWCSYCTLKCRSAPGLSSHMKRHEYQGDC